MKQAKHRKNLDYARKKEVQDDSQIFGFDNWNYWETSQIKYFQVKWKGWHTQVPLCQQQFMSCSNQYFVRKKKNPATTKP